MAKCPSNHEAKDVDNKSSVLLNKVECMRKIFKKKFKSKVIDHLPYSPNLAPNCFHPFLENGRHSLLDNTSPPSKSFQRLSRSTGPRQQQSFKGIEKLVS